LPATTQLEHWDIHTSYGHTDVLLNRPAIAPVGGARTNTDIFRALAQRMGFDDPCFAESDESLCRSAVGDEKDFEQLLAHGFASLPVPDAPFAPMEFGTEIHELMPVATSMAPSPPTPVVADVVPFRVSALPSVAWARLALFSNVQWPTN
jgi:hypothetical protein